MFGRPHISEQTVTGRQIRLPLVPVVAGVNGKKTVRIPWHSHTYFELLFVLDGATAYEIADGRRLDLMGGQFFVVPPGVEHRGVQNLRTPSNVCGLAFDPRASEARKNTPFTSSDLKWLRRQFEQHSLSVRPLGTELRRLMGTLCRLRDEFAARAGAAGAAASFRLTTCAVILQAANQLAHGEPDHTLRLSATVLAHVEAHYGEPLRAADLARAAGCSRSRLFQIFKRSTGMTPTDYIQRLRVNKVSALMLKSTASITDLALAAGFSSSQYFCKVFRKYAGATPGEFRRRHQGSAETARRKAPPTQKSAPIVRR
ncbi:MAG: AraC family transcriptional regulator [Opitutus sp.]|nr:AraC family transcriptional regulator [Opitutus sp.]